MLMHSSLLSAASIVFIIISNVHGLSSSKSPGDQFRLNNWKLTLPDSSASEISPDDLEDDYESSYFYTASDGSMTFYVPGSGGTTDTAKYPRSELRQLCNPDASSPDRYNWDVYSYNFVEGKYRIGDLDSSSRKVVIQQIHAYDAPPLIKCQYESNKVYCLIKTDSSGDNEEKELIGSVDDNEQFTLKTVVTKYGNLKVYFNGNLIVTYSVGSYWGDYKNYFKAGNYLQSNSDSAYAYVHIYALSVYTGSSNCDYTSSFTTDNGDASTASTNTAIIVTAVSILAVVIIGGAIFGFCYWKKNKSSSVINNKEEIKDFEEDDNNNNGGDTPVAGIDGAGSDTPNTQSTNGGSNDMDILEIEVQHDNDPLDE